MADEHEDTATPRPHVDPAELAAKLPLSIEYLRASDAGEMPDDDEPEAPVPAT